MSYSNAYSSDKYSLKSTAQNQIIVTDGETDYLLSFNVDTGSLDAQIYNYSTKTIDEVRKTFSKLIDISFLAQDNIVLCTYSFSNFTTYTSIIKFGVS